MSFPVKELIHSRKSVRTFTGEPVREADRNALQQYAQAQRNPFGVPVTFRLLDAAEHGLTSPVILGASLYLAAKVEKTGPFEIGFGYSFEEVCLYAESLGLGTVMLAGSLNRAAFEKAMELRDGEVLPAASPVGYPAEKRSLRETLMRRALKADERIPFEKLFFAERFGEPLSPGRAGVYAQALEMARWAPSAANRQPFRAVADGETFHFYEAKSMGGSPLGDVQKVDIGIALAHFDLTLREEGVAGRFFAADPGLTVPANVQYMMSWQRTE